MNSRRGFGERLDGDVVAIRHPMGRGCRVAKEQRLVTVVLLDGRVAIEVIRGEIRQDANARRDARRVVQLEGGDLQRNPFWRRRSQRDFREWYPDVASRHGA